MNATEYNRGTHEITDVLTQLKGLVLVQPILEARGVSNEELERHTGEIDRVRATPAVPCRQRGVWVEPGVYCRVRYLEWTNHGLLRGASYRGLLDEAAAAGGRR